MTSTPTDALTASLQARLAQVEEAKVVQTTAGAQYPEAEVVTGEVLPPATTAVEVAPPPPPPSLAPTPAAAAGYPAVPPPKVVGGLPYASEYMRIAKTIANTEMVPDVLRGRPDAIFACFMQGYELGIGPIQAVQSINIIKGKPALSAELMRALIIREGHYFVADATNEYCDIEIHRKEWPADKYAHVRWDIDDAKKAGLTSSPSWGKYTRAMLDARATSEAARRFFPEVISGMSYTPEEVQEFEPSRAPVSAPMTQAEIEATVMPVELPPEPPPAAVSASEPAVEPAVPTEAPPPSPVAAVAPPEPAPAPPARADEPKTDSEVRKEMREVLMQLLRQLDRAQKALAQGYLASHGMGDVRRMSAEKLQQAIDVVAGWPDSVADQAAPAVEVAEVIPPGGDDDPGPEPPEGMF